MDKQNIIVVRGAGDLASGVIWTLHKAKYNVIALETKNPSAIRRAVSFSECVYNGKANIEGVESIIASNVKEAIEISQSGKVAMLIDENANSIKEINPQIVVDAILAKKNMGTRKDFANLVISLGPGFIAGKDCHFVIETMRGHTLGRIYEKGSAIENTGMPGLIESHDLDRVIHSSTKGIIHNILQIGDVVKKGDTIAIIENEEDKTKTPVLATIDGVLRGLIHNNFNIPRENYKIADIDPRITERNNCFTISDKARALGGAVLLCIKMNTN
ncbi:MAG: selenium-dependent molybdenum cofactor biosynthesis protein YqeB [Eubacteriales bacterium]|nr:selenium-dependent molybdenum cofactor biosynthesis protein YqeB [Eubacteriales bacterium]